MEKRPTAVDVVVDDVSELRSLYNIIGRPLLLL